MPRTHQIQRTSENNFIDGAPKLGPLADYGGRTPTMLPLPSSPVVDPINGLTSSNENDQRGFFRPVETNVDFGAVEFISTERESGFALNIDVDRDGSSVGLELAIGTDPFLPDSENERNLSINIDENGFPVLQFGFVSTPMLNSALLLTRTTGLESFPTILFSSNQVSNMPSSPSLTITDENPPENAFYRLELMTVEPGAPNDARVTNITDLDGYVGRDDWRGTAVEKIEPAVNPPTLGAPGNISRVR